MGFYQDSYLRFCSQKYSLSNLSNRYVHLADNSVQKYSKKKSSELEKIEGNMWTSKAFAEHLTELKGKGGLWENVVQAGMRRIAVATVQCVQEAVESRKNSLELFGYDFMIDEKLHPWLIEVNCSPTMEHSTPITKHLCRVVMEDILKVSLDLEAYRRRLGYKSLAKSAIRKFDTGRWELAYRGKEYTPVADIDVAKLVCTGAKAEVHTQHSNETSQLCATEKVHSSGGSAHRCHQSMVGRFADRKAPTTNSSRVQGKGCAAEDGRIAGFSVLNHIHVPEYDARGEERRFTAVSSHPVPVSRFSTLRGGIKRLQRESIDNVGRLQSQMISGAGPAAAGQMLGMPTRGTRRFGCRAGVLGSSKAVVAERAIGALYGDVRNTGGVLGRHMEGGMPTESTLSSNMGKGAAVGIQTFDFSSSGRPP